MRTALQALRGLGAADDEFLLDAVKNFAGRLGNECGASRAREAIDLYDEFRRSQPLVPERALWCAMAARDAGEADRLDHFLQLTLQLLGERPAVPNHLCIAATNCAGTSPGGACRRRATDDDRGKPRGFLSSSATASSPSSHRSAAWAPSPPSPCRTTTKSPCP